MNQSENGKYRDPSMHILLSLLEADKHGYRIMEDIRNKYQIEFSPGTLYGAISRLEKDALIVPLTTGGRSSTYRITPSGIELLRSHVESLQEFALAGSISLTERIGNAHKQSAGLPGREAERAFQSKLSMPRIGSHIVRRKKIEDKLRLLAEYKLAFLSAPAGYGKTTAVADYLKRTGSKHAWLSIDEVDNDPVRFWKSLVASVSRCLNDDGIARLSMDECLISSNITVELFISTLETIPERFVLILDDCHLIENETILNSIEYFVQYMPANVDLILINRKEAENVLSLLRARGTAISLNARDLAFDYDETAEFFAQKDFHLTKNEIKRLERCTEGWAAGLLAASFSIRDSESIDGALRALSGRDKNIALILDREVFAQWTGEVREFLIRTSFLERLCGPLCAAVTGNERSAELLKQLCQSNGFVVPLDSEDCWFRYHHLFQEFLLSRLDREDEAVRNGLYGRAGAWYLQNGEITDAVDWLLKAGEYETAYPVILNYRAESIWDRDYSLWKEWLFRIPESFYENDPGLYVSYSWISSMENRLDTAEEWFDKARACFERVKGSLVEKDRDNLEAQVLFAGLNIALSKMDLEQAILDWDRLGKLNLSEPLRLGELNWSEPGLLKTAYGFKGRLALVEKYLSVMGGLPQFIGSFSAYIAVIVAEFFYERNELDQIGAVAVKNMGSIMELNMPGVIVPAFILLAKVKRARGDWTGAFKDIEEAKKRLSGETANVWRHHLDIFTAALHLSGGAAGDAEKVAEMIDTGRIGPYDALSAVREFEYITYARYLMRLNRLDDALLLLGRLSDFAERQNQLGSRIELKCLEAVCYKMKSNYGSAISALEQALALGMEEGYARTFVDEGEPMAALLIKYIHSSRGRNGSYLAYARSLLRSTGEYVSLLKDAQKNAQTGNPMRGLTGLLTARETEVLRLLTEKKSNKEIAGQLYLSVSGVKQCTTRIYDKLGVNNRLEAIKMASEMGCEMI